MAFAENAKVGFSCPGSNVFKISLRIIDACFN